MTLFNNTEISAPPFPPAGPGTDVRGTRPAAGRPRRHTSARPRQCGRPLRSVYHVV